MSTKTNVITTARNEGNSIALQNETAIAEGIDWFVDAHDMLLDLKVLMSDFYVATFMEDGKSLKLLFNNGQQFKISVENCA